MGDKGKERGERRESGEGATPSTEPFGPAALKPFLLT